MRKTCITLIFAINCCYGQSVKSFSNGNIQLFYEEKGSGPALYILTGGPGAFRASFYEVMDSLKAAY